MKQHTRISIAIIFLLATMPLGADIESFSSSWPDTDFTRSSIDLDEIISGGPPKDGIPAIDQPRFDSVEQAARWVNGREPVISLFIEGKTRAYPLQILMFHEIVNDQLNGIPVAVTFCPLCNAAIVFDRRIDDSILDFGTTGLLRKSDLMMYDRQSESWWQQFSGKAVVGDMLGHVLKRLAVEIVAFEDFAAAYPEAEVLNRDTGHRRPYGRNPYSGYDDVDKPPFLFVGKIDERLPPMERVISVSVGSKQRIYPFRLLSDRPVINDRIGESDIVIFSKPGMLSVLDNVQISESRTIAAATAWQRQIDDDTLKFEYRSGSIIDSKTGSKWNLFGQAVSGPLNGSKLQPVDSGVHFAFAWLAFNPDSEIYHHKP